MNVLLLRALIALIPISMLLTWSVTIFVKARTVGATLQLVGAASLVVVVLTHVAEAVHAWPSLGWGEAHRIGHYVDLSSAMLGIALVSVGLVVRALRRRGSRRNA